MVCDEGWRCEDEGRKVKRETSGGGEGKRARDGPRQRYGSLRREGTEGPFAPTFGGTDR
jgi:hypothetical protein